MNAPRPSSVRMQLFSSAEKVLQQVLAQVAQTPERLSEILEASAEPLIAFVADRTMSYANRAAEQFFGVERHQLEGRNAESLLPERLHTPGAPPQVATSDLTTVEVPALRADGTELPTAWTFAAVSRPNAEPIFVMILRARAQLLAEHAALQRSDRRFSSLLIASTSIIWVSDAAGRVEELLPTWEEYTGQAWEQYEGFNWISAIHPEERSRVMTEWHATLQQNADVFRTQGRIWSAKHNTWRAFQTRAVCARKSDGAIEEWVGSITDVQDSVEALERLRESEARYNVLFEQTPTAMALSRITDGVTVAINQAFAELFELSVRDAIGKPSVELGIATAEQRAEVYHLLRDRGSVRNHECERRTTNGKVLFVSLSLNYVQIAGVTHILTTVTDISARREQEVALARAMEDERQARSQAEAANRAKDEFLATISHELRTPLQAILGWSTLLVDTPLQDPKHQRGLEVIGRNARAQERLISDLLDMSRIVSGKLSLTMARVTLEEVIEAAVEVVRPAAMSKGVALAVSVDPQLPALIADGARLQQIFWNLLANAVRHTRRAGQITIVADQVGDGVRVVVQDTGEGISPEHLASIFDRYRQLESSTTRKHGGLGLGLAIVRHLVEAHGGQVEAHSEGPGHGATFSVTLPVLAVSTQTVTTRADGRQKLRISVPDEACAALQPTAAKIDLQGIRVMVVEDQPDSLELLGTVLQTAGAEVTAVDNAGDALEARGPFDVIISDIGLPQMDGYELLRHIRARGAWSHVPVIALTAFAGREHIAQARRAGFQEHVAKPVDPSKLLETVRRWAREQAP